MKGIALLIIDLQVGNFSEPDPIVNGKVLLRKARKLISKARNKKTHVIFIQNNGGKGDPDELNTKGWEIHPLVAPIDGEIIIQKTTPDSFHETRLHEVLNSKDIKELIITGLQTEYCIDATCRRASILGFKVTLVKDVHSTWDTNYLSAEQIIYHHNEVLSGWFVKLKTEKEIKF